ncbi:MAG: leucine-rich repeat domain-containing protein [Prolixibacteraceae bacterium]
MNDLYHKLIQAYSENNLNRITGKLIDLYRNKNYREIRDIANRISRYVTIDEEKDARCFSRLIMLYHPDKGAYFKNCIRKLYGENDWKELEKYSHILLIDDIDTIQVTPPDDDIDYNPEYMWDDIVDDGYSFVDFDVDENYEDFNPENIEKSFYNAMKMREFGTLNISFPNWYLEDYDEFEMVENGLHSLDGLESCKQVVHLNLTNNEISDITALWNLKHLEELYLANNQIGFIDAVYNLKKLRVIDLAGNQIDDISPLYHLENLEYVNLTGNNIPEHQIDELIAKNIIVMF